MKEIKHVGAGRGMTLIELEAFIQDARRHGASGTEVTKVVATVGGKVKSLTVEVSGLAPGSAPQYSA